MHAIKLIDAHFWLHTLGVVFYIVSMWIAGITQGLMWRATNSDGTLTYSFVESLVATSPSYLGRFFGGVLVLAGMVLMACHMWRTWQEALAAAPNSVLAPGGATTARGRALGFPPDSKPNTTGLRPVRVGVVVLRG